MTRRTGYSHQLEGSRDYMRPEKNMFMILTDPGPCEQIKV